jgi:Putative beta barrel porin-7 (BBP7)
MRNRIVFTLVGVFLAASLASAQQAEVDAVLVIDDPSASPTRLWGETDFLTWWLKSGHAPPLVSAGPLGSGAILGQGGVPLFGGSLNDEPHYGGLFRLGYWYDDSQTVGVEGDYFFLATRTAHFSAGSNGAPGTLVIGRPFFNVNSQSPDAELVAEPGVLAGAVGVGLSTQLQGADLDAVYSPTGSGSYADGFRLEFLGGFRWLQLKEGLGINENLQVLPGVPGIGGEIFDVLDAFGANNNFYGGQVGAHAEFRRGAWFLDVCGKLGLGDTHETVTVVGATSITPVAGPTTTARGGLLALPSNINRYSRDVFGFVPEVGVTLGYQPVERVRLFAGYTFLYWSEVARPGNEIDFSVNPTRLPVNEAVGAVGANRPGFTFNGTDFWAQGIRFGVEFQY